MREIYNEGRVVGLSAYELFVRQHMSTDQNAELPSEREWLAASVGCGNSMILRIPKGTSEGYHDYKLPEESSLCACSTIIGSAFTGAVEGDVWATRVTDYGYLIPNNEIYAVSPSTPGDSEDVPGVQLDPSDLDYPMQMNDYAVHCCQEYPKILDGIVFQPGEWSEGATSPLIKNFVPDISKQGIVRIRLSAELNHDVLILLTGFMIKEVIAGMSGFDECMNGISPYNGDFLGPMSYPWACKIVFTQSNEVTSVLNNLKFIRSFDNEPEDTDYTQVKKAPVIDLEDASKSSAYESTYKDAVVDVHIKESSNTEGVATLSTLTSRKEPKGDVSGSDYPPSLYYTPIQTAIEEETTVQGFPVDIAAPGTIKLFNNKTLAQNYSHFFPDTYGMHIDEHNQITLYNGDTEVGVTTSLETESYTRQTTSGGAPEQVSYEVGILHTGTESSTVVKLPDDIEGQSVMGGSNGKLDGDLTWAYLLSALEANMRLDWMGTERNYLRFGDVNLYISTSAPTGTIPNGSIGIGW